MALSTEELWEEIKRSIPIKVLANMLQEQRTYQGHIALKAHALLCSNPECKMHSPGGEGKKDISEWMEKVAELSTVYNLTFQEINILLDLAITVIEEITSSDSPAFLMELIAEGWKTTFKK